MTEVDELQLEVAKKTALLHRMRELCIFNGFSREGAFEQAHGEYEIEEEPEDSEEEPPDDESNDESDDTWIPSSRAFAPKVEDDTGARIKSVYRKLAQALHPDLAAPPRTKAEGETQLEYWHETQRAYEAKDLETLELLWTMVQLTSGQISNEFRLFDLRSALKAMMDRLRSAKSEKRRIAKNDPSWKFEKKDRAALSKEIRTEFEQEAEHLRGVLADLEEDLAVFKPRKRREEASKPQMTFDL